MVIYSINNNNMKLVGQLIVGCTLSNLSFNE